MRLAIIGATGRTGRHLVNRALDEGHEVTAIVRDPNALASRRNDHLRVVAADAMEPASIAPGIAGSDAVVTAISGPGRAASTIWSDSVRSVITAMRQVGARRLVAITGSVLDDTGDGRFFRYMAKPLVRRILRGSVEDMRRAEDEIHRSGLDWTIVRAPALNNKPGRGSYRTALERNVRRQFGLTREDLAACVLDVVVDETTIKHHVFVAQ
jgi:putative NADH-flavin reductase